MTDVYQDSREHAHLLAKFASFGGDSVQMTASEEGCIGGRVSSVSIHWVQSN